MKAKAKKTCAIAGITLTLSLFFSLHASAKAASPSLPPSMLATKTITFCSTMTQPPFEFYDTQMKLEGLDIDIREGDAEALRRFAGDVVGVFERGDPNPFIGWFRAVSATVGCLRCVFDDSEAHARLVHGLRLQNLDSGILGPNYEEESLVIEPGKNHFDLLGPELIAGHLERVLAMLT